MKSQHKLLSLAGFFVKGKPFFFFTCLSKLPLEKKPYFLTQQVKRCVVLILKY